jgi:hypothetical protein
LLKKNILVLVCIICVRYYGKQGFIEPVLWKSPELWMWDSFQEDNMFRRNRRLVCFDMDSTLKTEVIDELADLAGVGEQVSSHYRSGDEAKLILKKALNNVWLC